MSETCNYYKIIKIQREIEHPVNVILYMSNKLTLSDSQNVRDGENGHLYGAMTIFIVCHNPYFPLPIPEMAECIFFFCLTPT